MLLFGVTIPATVPQRSEIPEGLINYPILLPAFNNLLNSILVYCNMFWHTDLLSSRLLLKPPYQTSSYVYVNTFISIPFLHTTWMSIGEILSAARNWMTARCLNRICSQPSFRLALNRSYGQLWVQCYFWWKGDITWLRGASFMQLSFNLINKIWQRKQNFSACLR